MILDRRLLFVLALAAAPAAAAPQAQRATPFASAWSPGDHSAIRLVAGGEVADDPDGALLAGLEIRLDPGFKTYWRDPGESGVPPVFDWSGSDNVAGVEVRWPAPRRFRDGGGYSIGYKADVLLPLIVRRKDANKPVRLVLKLDYAVCEKMCIPAQGSAVLALPAPGSSPQTAAVAAALAGVPAKVALGPRPAGAAILAVRTETGTGIPKLVVGAELPADAKGVDLFVEGPSGSYFGLPSRKAGETPGQPTRVVFVLQVEDWPKAVRRAPLRITLAHEAGAIEAEAELDLDAAPR